MLFIIRKMLVCKRIGIGSLLCIQTHAPAYKTNTNNMKSAALAKEIWRRALLFTKIILSACLLSSASTIFFFVSSYTWLFSSGSRLSTFVNVQYWHFLKSFNVRGLMPSDCSSFTCVCLCKGASRICIFVCLTLIFRFLWKSFSQYIGFCWHAISIVFIFGIFRAHFHFHVFMRLSEWMNQRKNE